MFSAGVAMLLSALFVHFRDIQPIWEVFAQILFYASPVIISIQTVIAKVSSTRLLHIYMLNPLAVIFQQFRHAMITNATPSAGDSARQLERAVRGARDRGGDLRRRLRWCSTARPRGSRRISEMDPSGSWKPIDMRQMAACQRDRAAEREAENERLRARVAALEAELVEVQARTNAAIAKWQERAYWLDRWHLDLNALMRRPGAAELRGRATVRGRGGA